MERRDFIILAATGAAGTLTLQGCGANNEELKPLYIANDKYIAGADYWHATICRECSAGCGVIVRKRDGKASKIEGNPLHPISRGKSCVRGQAALNRLYNPDRLRGPRKRTGERGAGQFADISWEEAIKTVADRISSSLEKRGLRSACWLEGGRFGRGLAEVLQPFFDAGLNFLSSHPFARTVEQSGWPNGSLPTFDLAKADYILSFGARFLETWASPVYYTRGYGEMRRGGKLRGRFVHAEPRLSLTAASADQWLPVKPGGEGYLALAIATELLRLQGKPLPAETINGDTIGRMTDVDSSIIAKIAKELSEAQRVAVLGGESAAAHTNGVFNMAAINYLGSLVNGAEQVRLFSPPSVLVKQQTVNLSAKIVAPSSLEAQLAALADLTELLLIHDANPLYHAPAAFKLKDALAKIPFVVSFSSFEDETTAFADLILPDHTPFERWDDDIPAEGVKSQMVSLAQPVVEPLYQTRQIEDVLLEVARQTPALAGKVKDEGYLNLLKRIYIGNAEDADDQWEQATLRGGLWEESAPQTTKATETGKPSAMLPSAEPEFSGGIQEFPLYFLPYEHLALGAGQGANSPILQELPDPMASVCWGSWVEVNPYTAARMQIMEGDWVAIESTHGRIEAPVVIYPGIRPDTIAMPAGQGHERYGRYATGRGANPLQILAPLVEEQTGQLAWAATRVKITKIEGKGKLVMVGTSERVLEEREGMHR
jgi:anaerobic selenocysteine-containing dehydrogenase